MNLNQLINKNKTPMPSAPETKEPSHDVTQDSTADAKMETVAKIEKADESKPSVPLKIGAGLKLGKSIASPAIPAKASATPVAGLKLGSLPKKSPTPVQSAASAIPDDLDLSALASLDTSEIPVDETERASSAMQFPDEIEATAPVRELPEDLTAQQLGFVESLDVIYQVLHDPELLGGSIRMVMQELQVNPEYTKLVSDHDVHTMIKSIRNVMGITKIRKDEKSAGRAKGGRKTSASSKFDADTMAQLDAMMAGSKAFDDD